MSGLKIDTFGGALPAVDDRLLPERAASHSENTWLYSGRLQGIPQPSLVRACTPGTAKVYRIPNNYVDAAHIDDSTWMEFQNPDTDIIRALVLNDTFERYYWASSSHEPRYNTLARIKAGTQYFKLGIPANAISSLGHTGGVGAAATRAYLTTWVSAYGEEGPASPPVTATGKVDDTWTLTIPASAVADQGGVGADRNLTRTRIYRTVTAATGATTYFLVAEIAIGTLVYADTLSDAVISSNSQLESTNWIAPPSDIKGWTSLPNGILAGWRGNELWFSEPYRPHAWPAAYGIVVDYPIVGLGVTNQTLVICTQAYPMTASGVHPASMALSKSASLEPCQSRGSILSTTEGVYYASPNGLVFAGQGSIVNITRSLITKDKWASMVSTATLRAARLGSAYYAFGGTQSGVFDPLSFDPLSFAQEDFAGAYGGVLIDPNDQRVAFNMLSSPTPVTSVQNDPWSGEIFILQSNNLYRINLSAADPTRRVYIWRSKILQSSTVKNYGAMAVYWRTPTSTPTVLAAPPVIPGLLRFPAVPAGTTYGVVRIYADDVLVFTRNLVSSGEIMRLPSGFKAAFWQIEFETFVDIYSLQFATTVRALKEM